VVIGADPSQKGQSLQEIDVMIRRRAQAGAKVIIVNPDNIGLTTHANAIHLQLKPGTDTALLAGLMSAVLAEGITAKGKEFEALKKELIAADQASSVSGVPAEKIAEAAKTYAAAKQPVVIFGTGISASEDASLQALNLANLKSAGVLPLLLEANALGVMQLGCLSDLGPGFAAIKKTGKSYGAMKSGMGVLFIAGNVPDSDFKAGTLIVQASHANALTEKADLVLPMNALYEKQGSIVNTYGQQKVFAQAQPAVGEAKDGAEIVEILSAAMSKTKAISVKDIVSLVKKSKAGKIGAGALQPVKAAAAKPYGISTTVLLLAMNQSLLSKSAVIKVLEVKQTVMQK
jgi:predicted molibdopterin-dependent oxidoreductase YjgC